MNLLKQNKFSLIRGDYNDEIKKIIETTSNKSKININDTKYVIIQSTLTKKEKNYF